MSRQRRERARNRAQAVEPKKYANPHAPFVRWKRHVGLVGLALVAAVVVYLVKVSNPPAPSVERATKVSLVPEHATDRPSTREPEGMVWIPGGKFAMGCDDPNMSDAQLWHDVTLDGFWIDKTEVTNEQYVKFVAATGYKTSAELSLDPKNFPGVPLEQLAPASPVFTPPSAPVPLSNHSVWWALVPGADWRHPEGPNSSIAGRENHPVVQLSWEDARAYSKWAGKRLPTEAEWEFAARGGLPRKEFIWGDEFRPGGKYMANTWQGKFPFENTKEDGFRATAPIGSYPANHFGLYDMSGNVWEWCADWYRPDAYATSAEKNPTGPPDSFDPLEPGMPKRVQRGGSFLCSDQYCKRYDPGGRGKGDPNSGANHLGFRCVRSK